MPAKRIRSSRFENPLRSIPDWHNSLAVLLVKPPQNSIAANRISLAPMITSQISA
jgi:hypothetical protein